MNKSTVMVLACFLLLLYIAWRTPYIIGGNETTKTIAGAESSTETMFEYFEIVSTLEDDDGWIQALLRDPYSDMLYLKCTAYQRMSVTMLYTKKGYPLTYSGYMWDDSHPLHKFDKEVE